MDVLLTHGYFLHEDPLERKIMKPYPPLGILYISSYLKQRGFDVEVFDTTFSTRDELEQQLTNDPPPIVGIYVTLMTRRSVLWLIERARSAGAQVVLGGPEPPNYAEEYLARGADVIVSGEGETALEELIPILKRGARSELSAVRGIAYRGEDGEVSRTQPREQLKNLDAQPFPDREAIDVEKYVAAWRDHHGVGSVSLITARGCPYTCSWCSHSVYGLTHRRRSPENVADELEQLRDRYRPDMVWYADDVFTINRRWLGLYAAELERRNVRMPFETITREDRLNERTIETLASMGCYRIWVGAESGSQQVLDKMSRRTNADRTRKMIRLLQGHGIRAGTFIMVGYEGETWDDIQETKRHLNEALPDDMVTTLAYPIKGTPYYEHVKERIVALKPWAQGSDRDLTVAGRHSRRFYAHAQRWLNSELAAARERHKLEVNHIALIKSLVRAKAHRVAMYLTRHEVEGA